ncbi:MAG: M56 family metallopeptidase [Peptococcaceae bacterium]|jgi:beta-lactamase regulating signal transducer with metallopeptidase domain|nr:M56 family metallopeptidase [Peptococcaceae bacterium]
MEKLFLIVLNMSLTASFVIAAIMLARLPLKKAPKLISYALWAVAGFRLVFPFTLTGIFSLLPFNAAPIPPDIAMQAIPRLNSGISVVDNTLSASLPAAMSGASVNPLQIWLFIGAHLWLFGVAVMLLYSVVSIILLKRRLRGAALSEDNFYEAENLKTPFVIGLFRPKIYLPAGLSDDERRYILLHERTHIRRRDHAVKMFAYLVLCVHWFNPFAWAAFWLLGADMEMSCDERVMKELGGDIKTAYSLSLVRVAAGRKILNGSPLAFGEGGMKERVKNVLNFKKKSRLLIIAAVALAVVLSMGFAVNRAHNRGQIIDFSADEIQSVEFINIPVPRAAEKKTVTEANDIQKIMDSLAGLKLGAPSLLSSITGGSLRFVFHKTDGSQVSVLYNGEIVSISDGRGYTVDGRGELNDLWEAMHYTVSTVQEYELNDGNDQAPLLGLTYTVGAGSTQETSYGGMALAGTTRWSYENNDGTTISFDADALQPLDRNDYGGSVFALADEAGIVSFYFTLLPETYTVRRWNDRFMGDASSYEKNYEIVASSGYTIPIAANDGNGYVYEVHAQWPQGDVYYAFRVTATPTPATNPANEEAAEPSAIVVSELTAAGYQVIDVHEYSERFLEHSVSTTPAGRTEGDFEVVTVYARYTDRNNPDRIMDGVSREYVMNYTFRRDANAENARWTHSDPAPWTDPAGQLAIPAPATAGIALRVKENSVSASGLTLVLENGLDKQVTYGDDYKVARLTGGRWADCDYLLESWGFNSIGYALPAGESREQTIDWTWIYGRLETGHYRITKSIVLSTAYDAAGLVLTDYAVEFDI